MNSSVHMNARMHLLHQNACPHTHSTHLLAAHGAAASLWRCGPARHRTSRYYCKEFAWTDWEPSLKDAGINERVRFRKVQCTEKHKGARIIGEHEECKKLKDCAGIETKQIEKVKPSDAIWVEVGWPLCRLVKPHSNTTKQ